MDTAFITACIKDIRDWLNIHPLGCIPYYTGFYVDAGFVNNNDIDTKIENFKATQNITYIFFNSFAYSHLGYKIKDNKIETIFYYPFDYPHYELIFNVDYDIDELDLLIKQNLPTKLKNVEKITESLNSLPTSMFNYMINLNKPIQNDEIVIEI